MGMTGAEVIVDALIKEDVKAVFGYPGGAVIDIFDCLYDSPINFYLVRHEQAAAHAADGYAKATGKPGVCLATSGPGATNLVTGIATANMDSIPMVAITGQVPAAMIGNDAFQEVDITGITRPITKHNYLVKDVNDLPVIMKEAFYIASTGRPGPVLIDVPKNVQQQRTNVTYPDSVKIRGYQPTYQGHAKQIEKIAEAIKKAKRPLIYAGGGVLISGGSEELLKLVEKTRIPVTTTLMGLGCFPETHPLSLKMLGMHGSKYANFAVMECDLLISIGARFDDRITGKISEFAPHAKIIHIDIDPSAISKNVTVHVPVVGDARQVLADLNKIVEQGDVHAWVDTIAAWKKEHPLSYSDEGDIIKPQYVVEKIYEVTQGDAIITTEVGQNQMWAAQFYKYTVPRQFLSSGGLGTMGYGFPAAIGAQIAFPHKTVFDIAGDGSIQMNIQELATAVTYKLPVNIAILNNNYLGMVRQWQELFYGKRYSGTCLARDKTCPKKCDVPGTQCPTEIPDFVKVAEGYSAVGMRITKKADVEPALREAIKTKNVVVMDFVVSREENVFPMVPANASLKQMISGIS
ncbi:MAG: biosynthetic-type acetolactate synthase large subunit [Candidatus Auribacter fodinae]|jgi:acetolactate synthase-1/2/3 large subunit|uniref:Acetolactate synthase n=1 Tax=Candidatus Auribacter fodinae TaxID=2093366 RepID=A0A3A4R1B2_9BACT|nr:MAG: biosynthetic-type acetolactate synthase large subunit [Candidatus Auribacter fodinae]